MLSTEAQKLNLDRQNGWRWTRYRNGAPRVVFFPGINPPGQARTHGQVSEQAVQELEQYLAQHLSG